ncbi:putative oxidoreductase [Ophiocordyceps camponoti-floridani]|uniref:Putative oxidoreductase n=1 Tax=Ophiocordyceps camponoti-floridani TaxID=2030778 RepID=A0A8H4VAW9_9HYPO|nr:putative oxidoreductase [Ophiocordyceps camponoti-floridani]
MAAAKRIVVCGGSGFLGSRVCKHAVTRGWDVTSISRSGTPNWESVSGSAQTPAWAHQVSWESADILRPSTYASLLQGATFVVHSMGILLEADYKSLVSGKESPLAAARRLLAGTPAAGRGVNPLEKKAGEDIKPADVKDQLSYEVMNRDSAVALARHAADAGVGTFCYVSACAGAPILPSRYISTKREAERAVTQNFPRIRSVFVRPPFMYDNSRTVTMGLAAMVGAGAYFNSLTGKMFDSLMGAAGTRPLPVETVAEAIVEALGDETVRGPIDVPEIMRLAAVKNSAKSQSV